MQYQLSIFLHLFLIINLAKHLILFRTFEKDFDEVKKLWQVIQEEDTLQMVPSMFVIYLRELMKVC